MSADEPGHRSAIGQDIEMIRSAPDSPAPIQIIGCFLSPYVRKVLVVLETKRLAYEIDPIVPFFGNDQFSALSPVRRIPVLLDDRVTLADSSVICQYLEDRYPEPPMYPADIADRARARWLEEYADTRMGDVFIWRLFNEVAIKPFVFGQPTDQARVAKTLAEDVPEVLDYLETQLPAAGFCFGAPSIADVSIAVFFRNAAFAGWTPDAHRWPRTSGCVARTLALEPLRKLAAIEDTLIRTPPPRHRAALAEMGVPLTATTLGTSSPRPGVLPI